MAAAIGDNIVEIAGRAKPIETPNSISGSTYWLAVSIGADRAESVPSSPSSSSCMSSSTESNVSMWDGELKERGGLVDAVWTDVGVARSEGFCSLNEDRPLKELLTELARDGLRGSGCLDGGGGSTMLCCGDDIGYEDARFGPGEGRIHSLDRENSMGGEDMMEVPAFVYSGGVGVRFSRLDLEASVTDEIDS